MRQGPCPKCGSMEVVRNIQASGGMNELGRQNDLCLIIESDPKAWYFKESASSRLEAFMCSQCGYTELYAEKPKEIKRVADLAAKKKMN